MLSYGRGACTNRNVAAWAAPGDPQNPFGSPSLPPSPPEGSDGSAVSSEKEKLERLARDKQPRATSSVNGSNARIRRAFAGTFGSLLGQYARLKSQQARVEGEAGGKAGLTPLPPRRKLLRSIMRTCAVIAALVGALTAVVNVWARPLVNRVVLPVVCEEISVATGREVSVEEVRWIQPLGLLGVTPLVSAGPIAIGPQTPLGMEKSIPKAGPAGAQQQAAGTPNPSQGGTAGAEAVGCEESSAYCEEVRIGIRFLQSLLRWQCLLDVNVSKAFAKVVQCDNLSWFGYPLDTQPSSRNFFPGIERIKVLNRLTHADAESMDQSLHAKMPADPSESELIAKAAAYILSRQLSPPPITLNRVSVQDVNAEVQIAGERGLRRLEGISGQVSIGRDYHSFDLNAVGTTVERSPEGKKCTMGWRTDSPKRHLRGMTMGGGRKDALDAANTRGVHVSSKGESKLGPTMEGNSKPVSPRADQSKAKIAMSEGWQVPTSIARSRRMKNMYKSIFKKKVPTTGRVETHIRGRDLGIPGKFPSLQVNVKGREVQATLIERVFDFPLDMNEGVVNGEIRLKFNDKKSWTMYPYLSGRINCTDCGFHIWDAPDDFHDVNMDMIFENDRMYFHNATGYYGAIPINAVGDLSVDPDGDIRLVAHCPGVEVNALRETLAARPLPYSAAGFLSGTLHVTGHSEKPIYTGTAVLKQGVKQGDTPANFRSVAYDTMRDAGAAGAYDKVPFKSASSVFTFDSESEKLHLHNFVVQPMGGGEASGSGTIWCKDGVEEDPSALEVTFKGHGLPADQILKKYVPNGAQVPSALVLGPTTVEGSVKGGHLCPIMDVSWNSADAEVRGHVKITKPAAQMELHAPSLHLATTLHTKYQPKEVILAAVTQEQATAASRPMIEGAELKSELKGLDVLPLLNDSYEIDRMNSSQPIRLRLSGSTHFHGVLKDAKAGEYPKLAGEIAMQGLKLNHLSVARQMTGNVAVGKGGLEVKARGQRPDEGLDIDVKLPDMRMPANSTEGSAQSSSKKMRKQAKAQASASAKQKKGKDAGEDVSAKDSVGLQSSFSLRNRDLRLEAQMAPSSSKVEVLNLNLDELELASLRGTVDKGLIDLDFGAQSGRGNVQVTGPRFSGLQGESLFGSFRWEGDIVRLERAIVQQKMSRYELQGEYVLPTLRKDKSGLDMASAWSQVRNRNLASAKRGAGRWRWHVSVPHASIEEMLPAAQLLSRATSSYPIDYINAKGMFLEGVRTLQLTAEQITKQLESTAKSALTRQNEGVVNEEAAGEDAAKAGHSQPKAKSKGIPWLGSKSSARKQVAKLGLQDLRGKWKGSMQAYGSKGGSVVAEFDVKGEDWNWGSYSMESINAVGNYHPNEGLHFEKFQLDAGDASLRIAGNMLGDRQDAQFSLTDFPLALLQSLFNVLPSADRMAFRSTSQNLYKSNVLSNTLPGMAYIPPGEDVISGNLYVNAVLGGSARSPQGNISFQVLDGSLRNKKMIRAEANAAVTDDQRFTFNAHLQPAVGQGHVKMMGSTPFKYSLSPEDLIKKKGGSQTDSNVNNEIEVDVAVKDSGMLLLSTLCPQVDWQGGSADIAMQVRGTMAKPSVGGVAHVNRASVSCPWLSKPLSSLGATVRMQDNILYVDAFDGRVGRKGFIKISGFMPVDKSASVEEQLAEKQGIGVDAKGLEFRIKNAFTGSFDGHLSLKGTLMAPELSGESQFSKGVFYLVPQGLSVAGDTEGSADSTASVMKRLGTPPNGQTKDKMAGASNIAAGASQPQPLLSNKAFFRNFEIKLGPELRAVYPFVLNFGVAGEVELNGLLDQDKVEPAGILRFDSGDVNLVATQLSLNPEYPNRAILIPEQGLDPNLDISLVAPDLKALIQGRASSWQDHFVISVGSNSGETERLDPSEVARIFEGQFAESILEKDGRIAFSNLAASTISTLLPRIETQGQLGKAKWKLVSAPSIPGLLSLDPLTDPFRSLSNLTLGTEVELQFGKSLQALIARKLKESEMATNWTLLYQLNQRLRMRLNNSNSSGTRLLFEYSGEGTKFSPKK